jgi:large subunit ribosomal protein L6
MDSPGARRQRGAWRLPKGFTRELDIVGVGYRCEAKKTSIVFSWDFRTRSNIHYHRASVPVSDKQTHLVLTGVDRQLLGQVAANIRGLKKPDPYKQKGIRYTNERLKKKAGKAGGK